MKELKLPSTSKVNELRVGIWEPEGAVKGILQISHGMIEYIDRYSAFAEFLNKSGILVIANDHLGHGKSINSDEDLGYFAKEGKSATVVNDLHVVTEYAKKEYPNVPIVLLGHSMGSFMARRYLMTYGDELAGAIIMGTGNTPGAVLAAGKCIASLIGVFRGQHYRSGLIQSMSFSSYNNRIKPLRTVNDWLTKDEAIVDWYNANPLCTFRFTINGYKGLFDALSFIQKKNNIEKIPKSLPVFIVSGEEDPVGAYGAGPKEVYESFQKAGLSDVALKLYPTDRHEILNELDKEVVYNDLLQFLERIFA